MSILYAFINQDYFEAWCEKNNQEQTSQTRLQFLKEFGTPIIQYHDPQNDAYIHLEQGHCIHLNFNYYTELRRQFPDISVKEYLEQESSTESFMRSIKTWAMDILNKTMPRRHRRTAPAPTS
jgi:hypothetical protein